MLAAALADNRRCAYRVRPISTDNVELVLIRADERHVPSEIADVTCNGASIRFVKGSGLVVDQGEHLQVSIDSPNLEQRATISAKVVFSGKTTTDSLIGLAFDKPEELVELGKDEFFQLFNRRAAYRDVEPEPEPEPDTALAVAVMPVRSAPNNQLLDPVGVKNISATGICLFVGPEPDDFMRDTSIVRLALRLPGQRSTSDVVTRICYRTSRDEKVFYGCRFEWSETVNSASIIEDLTEYTFDRLDNLLDATNA